MKKLLLLAAFGLMASPAMAQYGQDARPTVPAGPTVPTVTVPGGVSGNYADVDQLGSSNDGDVDQTGTSSSAAHINQLTGGHDADIIQSDAGQNATIEQLGSGQSWVRIEQDADATTGTSVKTGNVAYFRQQAEANASVESFIVQSGNGNEAFAEFESGGSSNYAKQTQEGDDNKAYLWNDNPSGPNDIENIRESDQEQYGNRNTAIIASGGNQYGFKARQYQDGDDNVAILDGLEQRGYGDMDQVGNNNFASYTTSGTTRDASVNIDQDGDWNTVVAENWSDKNASYCHPDGSATSCMNIDVKQDGNYNEVFANANGNEDNEIFVNQYGGTGTGDFNDVDIVFNANNADVVVDQGSSALDVFSNYATVTVGTDNSLATVNQQGDSNVATINQ
jgi:hypothetical protein